MSGYLLYYLVIKPLSWLPLPVLYFISGGIFFMLFHVFGYRKKVVWENISKAFPEKSKEEQTAIMKQFYRHLSEILAESIKSFSISEKQVKKRVVALNTAIFDEYFKQGKSVIITGGHYNNWEWYALNVAFQIKHDVYGVYKPIKNKFFDNLMKNSRGRFGLNLISMAETREFLLKEQAKPVAIILGNDQSPSNPERAIWTTFMGRNTAVLHGTETIAKKHNWPVIYGELIKLKRGYYQIEYRVLFDQPKDTKEKEITEAHCKALEDTIRKAPQYYLWSHRRWKHTKD
jgi:KDO2-lipid IV(A) lauroyltransferase